MAPPLQRADSLFLKTISLFLAAGLVVSQLPGCAQQGEWDKDLRAADRYYEEGSKTQTILMLEAAVADAEKRGQNDVKLAAVLERLSALYSENKSRLGKATEALARALRIR